MTTEPVTFGSSCSGIEAASVAWSELGWRAVWLAEIDPFACAVLAHHYPDVPNLGDMNSIPQLLRNGDIHAPDVFCGGTPCQAFSVAGLRNSLDDARGNLSLKFCDIANEIDIQRAAAGLLPCIIKWENVPGVLSTKDNAFGCFLGQLAGDDEALTPEPCPADGKSSRYWKWDKKAGAHSLSWPLAGAVAGPQRAIAWRVLDAQYFGVAQRRRRVFVVASAREGFDPAAVLFEFKGLRRDTAPCRKQGEDVTGTLSSRTSGGGGLGTDFECKGGLQPVRNELAG
jgi:DNA (cytosine-5)-methyltransferase 1